MTVAVGHGMAGERVEMACNSFELEAESAAQRDITVGVLNQHDALPGQGCAIVASNVISTLA